MPELSSWNMPVVFPERQQGKGLRIVEGHLIDRPTAAASGWRFVDQGLGPPDHREGLEAEKVELHQPDFFDVAHRILGDDFVVGALIERHVVGERPFGDDDAGRMGRGMTGQAFERLRDWSSAP